jgi:hypothetical protein
LTKLGCTSSISRVPSRIARRARREEVTASVSSELNETNHHGQMARLEARVSLALASSSREEKQFWWALRDGWPFPPLSFVH